VEQRWSRCGTWPTRRAFAHRHPADRRRVWRVVVAQGAGDRRARSSATGRAPDCLRGVFVGRVKPWPRTIAGPDRGPPASPAVRRARPPLRRAFAFGDSRLTLRSWWPAGICNVPGSHHSGRFFLRRWHSRSHCVSRCPYRGRQRVVRTDATAATLTSHFFRAGIRPWDRVSAFVSWRQLMPAPKYHH